MTNPEWNRARNELVDTFRAMGYPDEFSSEVVRQLGSPKSMDRMTAYLRSVKPRKVEMIVDEMFAIMENRQTWIKKKEAEEANAAITMWYNRERTDE